MRMMRRRLPTQRYFWTGMVLKTKMNERTGAPSLKKNFTFDHENRRGFFSTAKPSILGEVAAAMALRILDGTPAGDIPIVYDSPNRPMINAGALRRITSYNVCYTKLLRRNRFCRSDPRR